MSMAGRLYLVDTSALAKAHLSQVRYTLQTLITDRVAATCVTIDLAAGYSGRSAADLSSIDARRRDRYLNLELNEDVADRAREVQVLLAEKMQHRSVGILDLLTAAVAEHHDAALIHYHPAFELISSITGQPQLWVATWGSLEAEEQDKTADSNGVAAESWSTPPPPLPHPMDDPVSQPTDS
ncbi:MAG TPA: PIN domain-containing protein [Sporichthya sp.]|nr:PIN domain-containing protein [Sporichthya sp.]